MLVLVGSTVCCGKAGSAEDGAATSGSGGSEASGERCSGPPASGLSTLMRFPSPRFDDRCRILRHIVAGWSWQLHDGRA
jgi:hypothetical protein